MEFDLAIGRETRYVRVTISGLPEFDELLSTIHLLSVESESWERPRVLVDLRGVHTPFDHAQQFRIGEEAAASLHHMERIAWLVPPERITRVSEKAARRMGANVRMFAEDAQAIRWLTED